MLTILRDADFWGPVSNFGIPIAAIIDTQKDAELISGTMTGALIVYSATFARYALAVTPKNYLLFGCHVVNTSAQVTQGFRWYMYHHGGGKEKSLEAQAKSGFEAVKEEGRVAVDKAQGVAKAAEQAVSK
ncbi:MAG: hypothetical protein MMC23_002219 [Stictis urceolatum]|nr:hypothetical protein [Stictis urceolata]